MKNSLLKDILVLLVMVGVVFMICLLLPDKVAIHYNAAREADMFVNRFFLLFGTIIPYSIYWRFVHTHNKRKM